MKAPYDKSNNDTYDEILSNDPAQDVEYHMYRDPQGRVKAGSVMGSFSTETRRKSQDLVLRFAISSEIGLPIVARLKRATLMPMTLVARYGLRDYTYSQKTPVFFDSGIDKFVVLMDYRFARDVNPLELFPDGLPQGVGLYRDKAGNKHLSVLFDTMKDARDTGFGNTQAEKDLLDAYTLYNMSLLEGERVIILRYLNKTSETPSFFKSAIPGLAKMPSMATCVFEYAQGYRFGDRYYLCDEEGNLRQDSSFMMDKQGLQSGDSMAGRRAAQDGVKLVVVKYTDEQYAAIQDLHARVAAMHDALGKLFADSINAEGLLDSLPGLSLNKLLPSLDASRSEQNPDNNE